MNSLEKLIKPYTEISNFNEKGVKKFIIEKSGKILFYFGAYHSNNLKNPQFEGIEKFWNSFIKKSKNSKIVFTEIEVDEEYSSKEAAIKDFGEASLTAYLANKEKVPTISSEIDSKKEFKLLEKEFTKEQIAYYYFARVALQWYIEHDNVNFEDYAEKFLNADKKASGWKNFNFSLKNMEKIHMEMFGKKFDRKDPNFLYDIIYTKKISDEINKVSVESTRIRDIYIVEKIIEKWEAGFDIFIVYGRLHALVHEKPLKKLLK